MKAAAFEYLRADNVEQALTELGSANTRFYKVLGGGQSLGPMINLRLVQPDKLIDVSGLSELASATEHQQHLRIGAAIRHAQIEDGLIPDVTGGFLKHVAGGIAHRAIRNRGTLGGSLAHADPSADWVAAMRLLDATLLLQSPRGIREVAARDFFIAAFTTCIAENEVLVSIDVPCFSEQARWAYQKSCRKPGEFADALAAVWIDPQQEIYRAVIGALSVPPYLIEGKTALQKTMTPEGLQQTLDDAGLSDPVERQWQATMLRRACRATGLPPTGAL